MALEDIRWVIRKRRVVVGTFSTQAMVEREERILQIRTFKSPDTEMWEDVPTVEDYLSQIEEEDQNA